MSDRFVQYAVKSASYLVLTMSDRLTRARRLVAAAPLTTDDGGAGGDFTLGVSAASAAARGVVKLAGQLGGTADAPDVRGLRITDGDAQEGPQLLALGAVKDGETLVRSGSTLVGTGARTLTAGTGLAGGGQLSADRTLSIGSFTGFVAHDVDPSQLSYPGGGSVTHLTLNVGVGGQLLPWAIRLPGVVSNGLVNQAVFIFDDSSTQTIDNTSTTNPVDGTLQSLLELFAGGVGASAQRNGRCVQQIVLRTNNPGATVNNINIGTFRVRAWASPRGAGTALVP